jgi:tetratricopeptide (TPR) repeat protein
MPADPTCPSSAELERLVLGRLPSPTAEELEGHVSGCPRCAALLSGLRTEDPLAEALRGQPRLVEDADGSVVQGLIGRIKALRPSLPSALGAPHLTLRPDATQDLAELLEPPAGPGEIGRLGDYRVLGVLGSGGMGAVYQAEQPRPRRRVALKVSLVRSAGRQARARHEPEVIARLQHPHIVPVYEAGEHAGRLYFAMELMEGGSLAGRLATAPLAAREAAELLAALAGAVHYAHEKGVVHRDLKPANVLLSADGFAKIADFGLAKLLDAPDGQTQPGAILGTPAYMAPEQVEEGRAVGPAADVYALGAILYECLTGTPPFRAATVLQTLEQVRTREPVAPGRLQPGLPRDLETICLKCLEKEPGRRYASAAALADDLGRFLRGEPIVARPVSRPERLAKWARRRPALAGLLLVSAVSGAALVAGGLVYNARLRAAVRRAEANEEQAWQQQRLATANYRAARDTLTRMLGRLQARRLADMPRLKELRQQQLEDTLAFYQQILASQDHTDPAVRQDTAIAYEQAATIQHLLGRRKEAAANFKQALALLEGLPAELREQPDEQVRLVQCHSHLANLARQAGRPDEARDHLRQALRICQRMVAAHPGDAAWQNHLARVHHNFGEMYQLTNRPAEAVAPYQRAIALRTALVRDHPRAELYRARLAGTYQNLGLIQVAAGRHAAAAATYARAEQLLAPLARAHPEVTEYALPLASICINWGQLLNGSGRSSDALTRLQQGIDLAEAVLRTEPRHTGARYFALNAHGARAQVYQGLRRYADAVKDWDRVIELTEDGSQRWVRRVIRTMNLASAGEHARAAAEADALAADPKAGGEGAWGLAIACARSVQGARSDTRLPPAERDALAQRYAARAVALLQKLAREGYFKDPAHATALRTDEDLNALRGRADFQKLLREKE